MTCHVWITLPSSLSDLTFLSPQVGMGMENRSGEFVRNKCVWDPRTHAQCACWWLSPSGDWDWGPWTFPPCCMHGSPVRPSREGPFFLQRQEAREVPPVFRSCPDEPEPCQWEEMWEKQTEPRATLSFTMVGEAQLAPSFSEWWFSTALNIRVNWELLETSMAGPRVRPSKSEAGHVAWARLLFFSFGLFHLWVSLWIYCGSVVLLFFVWVQCVLLHCCHIPFEAQTITNGASRSPFKLATVSLK